LGLLDGYLKLRTGSQYVTLGRDGLVAAIAAGALIRAIRSGRPLPIPPLAGFVLAFSALVLVELLNQHGRPLLGGLAGVRQHLEFVPLFFLGYAFVRRESQLEKFLLILVVCAAVGGVVSYIQSTLTPDQLSSWGPGYRERILGTGTFTGAGRTSADVASGASTVRPFGLGSDAGAGAVAAALALPAVLAMIMGARGRQRLVALLLAIGIALAIVTAGGRTSLITTLVSLAAFGIIAAGSRNMLRVSVALAVGTMLLYVTFDQLTSRNSAAQRTGSIASTRVLSTYGNERGASLGKFDEYASAYPLGIGVGHGGPASTVFRPTADEGDDLVGGNAKSALNYETQWNFLLLEIGLAGLVVYLLLNARLLVMITTRVRRIPDQTVRLQLAALGAPLAGLLVQGFAGITTASVPSAPYFWFVSGVLSYWLFAGYKSLNRQPDQGKAQDPAAEGCHSARGERVLASPRAQHDAWGPKSMPTRKQSGARASDRK